MAALIIQSPRMPDATAHISSIRPYIQGTAEAAADAIEHGRVPNADSYQALPHRSQIESLLDGVLRQLSVVSAASRSLAVPKSPSPREPYQRHPS